MRKLAVKFVEAMLVVFIGVPASQWWLGFLTDEMGVSFGAAALFTLPAIFAFGIWFAVVTPKGNDWL